MSRRCRASVLYQGSHTIDDGFNTGCNCGRTAGGGGPTPCTEPSYYGTNVLKDPGFEQLLGVDGGGPLGDAIPTRSWDTAGKECASSLMYPDTGAPIDWECTSTAGIGWFNPNGLYTSTNYWKVLFDNPRSGTFHARAVKAAGVALPTLSPFSFYDCIGFHPWSVKCEPGDLLSFSIYDLAPAGTPSGELFFELYDSSGTDGDPWLSSNYTFISGGVYSIDTSYTYRSVSIFIPSGLISPVYVLASYGPFGFSTGELVDVDDGVIGRIASGQSVLICSQAGLITIDNDTTETDFL